MVNIPTAADLEDHIVLAQRVELLTGAAAGGSSTNDKLTTMKGIRFVADHPETRINHGLQRTYGHGAPDISLTFTLSLTEEIMAYLRPRGLRDSTTGVIPVYRYAMKATPNNGTAKTLAVNAKLTRKEYIKGTGDQQGAVDVSCTLRVIDGAEPATT